MCTKLALFTRFSTPCALLIRHLMDVRVDVGILVFRYHQNHLQLQQHPVFLVVTFLVLRKKPSLLIQYHFLSPGCLLAFFSNTSDSRLSSRDTYVTLSFQLTFKRRIKSHLPFAGIIRSSTYSPRFQDKG